MIVKLEFLVQVVLLFKQVQLLSRVLNIVKFALKSQMRMLNDLVDQRPFLGERSCTLIRLKVTSDFIATFSSIPEVPKVLR